MLRIMCFAEEKIPKPELARLHLQFLDNRYNSLPPLYWVFGYLCMIKLGGRVNLILPDVLESHQHIKYPSSIPGEKQRV